MMLLWDLLFEKNENNKKVIDNHFKITIPEPKVYEYCKKFTLNNLPNEFNDIYPLRANRTFRRFTSSESTLCLTFDYQYILLELKPPSNICEHSIKDLDRYYVKSKDVFYIKCKFYVTNKGNYFIQYNLGNGKTAYSDFDLNQACNLIVSFNNKSFDGSGLCGIAPNEKRTDILGQYDICIPGTYSGCVKNGEYEDDICTYKSNKGNYVFGNFEIVNKELYNKIVPSF